MTLAQHIGARLRQLREERDITQADVADKLDWSPSRCSHVERGLYEPTIETVDRVSRALGVHAIEDVIGPAYGAWKRDQDARVAP